ncbi:hypothetical protein ACWDZ8_39700 [Streptomyces sp. NPDC003233]
MSEPDAALFDLTWGLGATAKGSRFILAGALVAGLVFTRHLVQGFVRARSAAGPRGQ